MLPVSMNVRTLLAQHHPVRYSDVPCIDMSRYLYLEFWKLNETVNGTWVAMLNDDDPTDDLFVLAAKGIMPNVSGCKFSQQSMMCSFDCRHVIPYCTCLYPQMSSLLKHVAHSSKTS